MIRSSALIRLGPGPAALTVLGDTPAAAAGRPLSGRRLALPLAPAALYWAGMTLNDYAANARERPIPSSTISMTCGHTGRLYNFH